MPLGQTVGPIHDGNKQMLKHSCQRTKRTLVTDHFSRVCYHKKAREWSMPVRSQHCIDRQVIKKTTVSGLDAFALPYRGHWYL